MVRDAFLEKIAVDRLRRRRALAGGDDHLAIRRRHTAGRSRDAARSCACSDRPRSGHRDRASRRAFASLV